MMNVDDTSETSINNIGPDSLPYLPRVLRLGSISTAPITYIQQAWNLIWMSTECREYLRSTRSEIAELIVQFNLNHDDGGGEFAKTVQLLGYPTTGEWE